ncbi:F0F1 ATP synthase subunit B [Hydromonas duriensis]|uniref:ATP synthase subunit b n=1 Tax=Hydromonas duriensis TaxID=1527608 RepID=A0A4R6Y6S1_9BURK|nr:F0F1 ATP synthase subunit B [Hydromonas duriensis]TDR30987.1 ATP synthase F0 subcomplex B subunit [Hydromonas duriensis]
MNINATLFIQTIVFFVLAWVTMQFIWPPMIKAIDERRQKIAEGLAAADKGNKSLEEAKVKSAGFEKEAREHAHQILLDAEKRAQAVEAQAKEAASVEAARIIAAAKADAEQEIVRAKESLRDQVSMLVVSGAEQILRREINSQNHAELLTQIKAQL